MNEALEKPDQSESQPAKPNYCKSGKCTACNLDEIKSCAGYEPTVFAFVISSCCYYGSRSGKCLKPEVLK